MQFKKHQTGMSLQMRVRRTALNVAPVACWVLAVATLAGVIGCGKQDSTPPAATDGTTAGGAADTAVSGADVVADAGAGVDQGPALADSAADAEVAAIDSQDELPTVPLDSDAGQVEEELEIAAETDMVVDLDAAPVPEIAAGPDADIGVDLSAADATPDIDDAGDVSGADVADAAGDIAALDGKGEVPPPPECALPVDCSGVLGPSADPCKGPVCVAGKCGWAALPVGATCDTDGLPCTGEKCAADGQCEFGGLIAGWCGILQDGQSLCVAAGGLNLKNPCEVCDPAADLTKWSLLDDGAKCGPTAKGCVTQTCKGGACVKAPDASLCAAIVGIVQCKYPSCDPIFGCLAVNSPEPLVCDGSDGKLCTIEKCDTKGNCAPTGEVDASKCKDGIVCTTDECSPTQGCVFTASPKLCDDGNSCTTDNCDVAKGGCTAMPWDSYCDDGTACTYFDVCENGSCVGKEPVVWSTALKTTGATILDVVDRSDGVYTAGTHGEELVVSHLDPSGKFMWESKVANAKWKQAGLVNLEGGGVAVVGDSAPAGTNSFVPKIVQIDKDGKVVATLDIPGSQAGAAANGNGPIWALGYSAAAQVGWFGGKVGVLEGRGQDLKPVWKLQLPASNMVISALRLTADKAGWFAVGEVTMVKGADNPQPFVCRVSLDGVLQWQRRYFGLETNGRLNDVVALQDGGGIAIGSQDASAGSFVPMAMRFNSAGGTVWKKTFGGPELIGVAQFGAAVSDGGEGIWTTPLENSAKQSESVGARIDGGGNLVQLHNLGALVLATTGNSATGMITLASSSLAVNPKLTLPATVFRTSGLFASECKDVGKCFGLAGKLCADGKPCTTDSCDAAKGCVHSDLSDGVACHDGDSCTLADACAKAGCNSGAPALLSVDVTGILVESAFTAEDGAIYACGRPKLLESSVIVAKVTPTGAVAWKKALSLPLGGGACTLIRPLAGDILVRGSPEFSEFSATVSPAGVLKSVSQVQSKYGHAIRSHRAISTAKEAIAGHQAPKTLETPGYFDAWINGPFGEIVIPAPGNEFACDVAQTPDGVPSVLIADAKNGALSVARVVEGKVLWNGKIGDYSMYNDEFAKYSTPRLVATANAEMLALAVSVTQGLPNTTTLRLIALDSAAAVVADKTLLAVAAVRPVDILVLPGGGYLVAATTFGPGFAELGWLARFDAKHALQWEETGTAQWSRGSRLFPHPAGALLVQHGKDGVSTRFRVIDAWGNGTCAQSGACFAKAVSDCDDGKPCTADACTADAVCSHTAIAACVP